MTTTTIVTLRAESRCYGKTGQYIARILGLDSKFTFSLSREFIGAKSDRYSSADVDAAGVYEICDLDEKGNNEQVYRLVIETPDGLVELRASTGHADTTAETTVNGKAQVIQIAKRMDAHDEFAHIVEPVKIGDEWRYRLRTKAKARKFVDAQLIELIKAIRAQRIEPAIANCWQVLQSLPQHEATAVLTVLRALVSPKPSAVANDWHHLIKTSSTSGNSSPKLTAIANCWRALRCLPERDAKAVLRVLRERVSSKPVEQPETEQSATETSTDPQTA